MKTIIKKIPLNDTEQYLLIRGEDVEKPVMLFLHGGPGIPELFMMKKEMSYCEEHFTMVYWEQRGAGKSYRAKALSLEQIVLDTVVLAKWLMQHYHKKKIFLMGHSWGSFLGMLVIEKNPELFHAYLGIGQVSHQYKAEEMSLAWIQAEAQRNEEAKALKKLSSLRLPAPKAPMKEWNRFLNLHRSILWRYGGTFYDNRGKMSAMIKNFIFAPEYSIIEKVMFVPSAFYSMKQLWHDVVGKNLFDFVKKVEVPVYIFQGKYDHQVSYALAKKFIEDLTAPQKYFYTFENSAHSPHIEENEKFNKCIENILKVYQ